LDILEVSSVHVQLSFLNSTHFSWVLLLCQSCAISSPITDIPIDQCFSTFFSMRHPLSP
jgi:hypothetical protein